MTCDVKYLYNNNCKTMIKEAEIKKTSHTHRLKYFLIFPYSLMYRYNMLSIKINRIHHISRKTNLNLISSYRLKYVPHRKITLEKQNKSGIGIVTLEFNTFYRCMVNPVIKTDE